MAVVVVVAAVFVLGGSFGILKNDFMSCDLFDTAGAVDEVVAALVLDDVKMPPLSVLYVLPPVLPVALEISFFVSKYEKIYLLLFK